MEGNEYDIFSELEHEIGRDLSQWRRDIIASFERSCLAAYEIEEAKTDPLNLTDPAVRESVRKQIIDFLIAEWIDAKESPRPGDFISVAGESYWHTLDSSNGDLETFRLPIGYKIQGSLLHWDVLPYIDEAGLEAHAHRDPELVYKHTHPFGLHLILADPTITNEHGNLMPIYPEQVYLPMHYERATLRLYTNPE
ncbi:hypothetical protein D3C73_19450 [compost metagenome]